MLQVKYVLGVMAFAIVLMAQLAIADIYQLAMSKEDAVCNYMLQLLNGDVQKYGELKYDNHPEFDAIKWTTVRDDYCSLIRMAQFDINNDGHDDVVLKYEGCVRGVLDDILYVYDKGHDAPQYSSGFQFDATVAKQSSGQIGGFPQGIYYLKEIPKFSIDRFENFHHISGIFRLNPFVFEGKRYVSMNNPLQKKDRGGKKYFVIVRYEQGNKLKDTCYFEKQIGLPRDESKKQQKSLGR